MSKKVLISLVCLLALGVSIFRSRVMALDEGTVTATVTVQNVAVTVADGGITYGTLAASGTKSTLVGEANDMQTATNTGNVTETINIKGANSTGCVWTLAGTQASEQYFHKFCNDTDNDCSTPPTSYTALTASYQELDTGIAATSGTVDFQLQIGVPSSTTCDDEATVTVTVQAVAGS